jgi:DNA-binding NtrC family response regulator
VRELENVLERASILCRDGLIRSEDIALPLPAPGPSSGPGMLGSSVTIRDIERAHIRGVLDLVQWNKVAAAEILGISLKTLYNKITTYELTKS